MMKAFMRVIVAGLGLALALVSPCSTWKIGETVNTSSGPVQGHAASSAASASLVSEYLGIPYGKAPIGDLRWAAPQAFKGSEIIDGINYGFSCPTNGGFNSSIVPTLEYSNVTQVGIQVLTAMLGQQEDVFSEDCLFLNVWTKPQVGEKKKAVLLWIHGGAFTSGSARSKAYNGKHIADEEDVVVVSINYRLNIFGFPGAPNTEKNPGLLDQRLAVAWVRDNIDAFGGDPSRITLFGQSAGGGSVDYYNFAWPSDPIVAGFISQSGIARNQVPASTAALSWFKASTSISCGDATSDPASVLSCMRSKDYKAVLSAITSITDFGPTVDNTIVFPDYDLLGVQGNFTHKPLLIGDNEYEAGLAPPILALADQTSPVLTLQLLDLLSFFCPTAARSGYSVLHQVPTWRYRYFGTFPDLTLTYSPSSGAWHGSEIPMVFGTDLDIQNLVERTPEQDTTGKYMRKGWATFAKDPEKGLSKYGWPQYQVLSSSLLRLAYKNATGPNAALPVPYDLLCPVADVLK